MAEFAPIRCTGYEGTGYCFWCGGEFKDKRKRNYCSPECRKEYYRHFEWGTASKWAKDRARYHCMECGKPEADIPLVAPDSFYGGTSGYRVHHIIPVNGEDRWFNPLNVPCNLIALCHDCHMKWHKRSSEYDNLPRFTIPVNQGVLL